MTKTYKTPMLQIVSIKSNDILTTSTMNMLGNYGAGVTIAAPGQRGLFDPDDSWDAGY